MVAGAVRSDQIAYFLVRGLADKSEGLVRVVDMKIKDDDSVSGNNYGGVAGPLRVLEHVNSVSHFDGSHFYRSRGAQKKKQTESEQRQ